MNATADLTTDDWFEAFHGTPRVDAACARLEVASGLFSEPAILDLKCEADVKRLPNFGLQYKHVEAISGDSQMLEHELRLKLLGEELSEFKGEQEIDESILASIKLSGSRNLPYVETILRSGHFLTLCPASGRAIKSDASFVVDTHHVAYRFTGDLVFYLMVGRFHGRRAALCVPSRNVLVTLEVPERGPEISRWVAQTMRNLIKLSVAQPSKFQARMEARTDELTLVTGGMANFGHHIWQELSGIAHLLATGQVARIRGLLVGPHIWFRLDQVFPELAQLPQTKCETGEDMLVNGLSQRGTILRPIGLQITQDLRARLRKATAAALGSEEMARIASAGAQCRLIWINLRAHNKMWRAQIEGYAALLNTLHKEHGNIGVVYDGWSDTAPIRDEIDRRLNPGIIRHDTLGVPIESSLAWAEAVTTYVSVVGSGLVLNSWLVQKPGIAHANRAHLRQRNFWNSVSQEMIPTSFIDETDVRCDGTLYGNYDFDWKIMLPQLRRALVDCPKESMSVSGQKRCLEIGPGPEPIAGFECLNIVSDGISDHVGNAANPMPFEDGCFDLIYASHILEHIPWTHTIKALGEWRRVLKPGGTLEVWVPDGLKICRQFVCSEDSNSEFAAPDNWYRYNDDHDACVWANGRIFTYGDGNGTLGHWNWHLALFSPRYLAKVLSQAGFTEIRNLRPDQVRAHNHGWINLGMSAVK